jgi:hypothetical protein
VWLASGKETGYAVDVPSVGMHAVARDAESFDKPCLLIQVLLVLCMFRMYVLSQEDAALSCCVLA